MGDGVEYLPLDSSSSYQKLSFLNHHLQLSTSATMAPQLAEMLRKRHRTRLEPLSQRRSSQAQQPTNNDRNSETQEAPVQLGLLHGELPGHSRNTPWLFPSIWQGVLTANDA